MHHRNDNPPQEPVGVRRQTARHDRRQYVPIWRQAGRAGAPNGRQSAAARQSEHGGGGMNQFGLTIPSHPDNWSAALGGISGLVLVVGGFVTWSYLAPLSKAASAPGDIPGQSHPETGAHPESDIINEA